ncbi:MAG: hypothetical protein V1846_03365 [Candidatus Komeilibacteria bacterium]
MPKHRDTQTSRSEVIVRRVNHRQVQQWLTRHAGRTDEAIRRIDRLAIESLVKASSLVAG